MNQISFQSAQTMSFRACDPNSSAIVKKPQNALIADSVSFSQQPEGEKKDNTVRNALIGLGGLAALGAGFLLYKHIGGAEETIAKARKKIMKAEEQEREALFAQMKREEKEITERKKVSADIPSAK